jgi:hypothetical protein
VEELATLLAPMFQDRNDPTYCARECAHVVFQALDGAGLRKRIEQLEAHPTDSDGVLPVPCDLAMWHLKHVAEFTPALYAGTRTVMWADEVVVAYSADLRSNIYHANRASMARIAELEAQLSASSLGSVR